MIFVRNRYSVLVFADQIFSAEISRLRRIREPSIANGNDRFYRGGTKTNILILNPFWSDKFAVEVPLMNIRTLRACDKLQEPSSEGSNPPLPGTLTLF